MTYRTSQAATFCSVLALAIAGATPAFAQSSAETVPTTEAPQATQETGVQDIVVTAQRRSERLQDVPLAVTAQSSESLVRAGVTTTLELPNVVPGLVITQTRGAATPYIRGVGTQNDSAGTESGVALYVDGVYVPSSSGIIFSFNNIERIEVLKGPQGTLFGRNDPSSTPTASADFSYASFQDVTANAYVSGPIAGDVLKADFAVHYRNQNKGYGTYLVAGGEADQRNDYGFRSKILFTPTDTTHITLAGDYYRLKTDVGLARVVLPGVIGFGGTTFKGEYNPQTNFRPFFDSESYGGSLKIVQDVGFGDLSSLTAYRRVKTNSRLDQDGTPFNVVDGPLVERFDTLQQEFLLQGKSGKLNWTTGLFYYWADAGLKPLFVRSDFVPPLNFRLFSSMVTNSYAAFAQGTYALGDATNLTVGLRYTIDRRTVTGIETAEAGNPLPFGTVIADTRTDNVPDSQLNKKLTWRFAIDHKLSDDVMIYASYNRGFKSGLFNTANPFQGAIEPEQLDAYSAGFKSEFLDRQVRLNVEGFYYDYKGIQLAAIDTGITKILNAASARVYGLDGELTFSPRLNTGRLDLSFGFSVLHAKYKSFTNAPFSSQNPAFPFGNLTSIGDASGNDMLRAPKWTLSTQFDYSHPVGDGKLGLNATWYHNSGFFFDVQNSFAQKSYDLVNGEIRYSFPGDSVTLRVFAKNLFNKSYLTQADTTSALGSQGFYGDPRTYGVGFSFKF
jgi:iron complex outermembrane receptor protein